MLIFNAESSPNNMPFPIYTKKYRLLYVLSLFLNKNFESDPALVHNELKMNQIIELAEL